MKELFIEEMPNFWAVRIREPKDFIPETFRTVPLSKRYKLSAIMGWMKVSPGRMVIQAYRFSKDFWRYEDVSHWIAQKSREGKLGEEKGMNPKLQKAIRMANFVNKQNRKAVFVVYDPTYEDEQHPELYPYVLAYENDVDTFFANCRIEHVAEEY